MNPVLWITNIVLPDSEEKKNGRKTKKLVYLLQDNERSQLNAWEERRREESLRQGQQAP